DVDRFQLDVHRNGIELGDFGLPEVVEVIWRWRGRGDFLRSESCSAKPSDFLFRASRFVLQVEQESAGVVASRRNLRLPFAELDRPSLDFCQPTFENAEIDLSGKSRSSVTNDDVPRYTLPRLIDS